MRSMLAHAGPERRVPRPLGTLPNAELHIARLKVCGSKRWPTRSEMQLWCRVSKAMGVTKKVFMKCHKCDVRLCVKETCFEDYHNKAQL